ncbi:MAG: hypothetical protein EPN40_11565 [Rhodanobacteraceae bacterium]|nr:MAG: hypothetical protein EPN40_11565 [Rhodanobacteraceae bacterium]
MDATSKTPDAGGRRGFQDYAKYIELACELYGTAAADSAQARAGYYGIRQPHEARSPRDPLIIAGELYSAAECLAALAEDFAAGAFDACALSSADAVIVGAGRLVCELRQRGRNGQ